VSLSLLGFGLLMAGAFGHIKARCASPVFVLETSSSVHLAGRSSSSIGQMKNGGGGEGRGRRGRSRGVRGEYAGSWGGRPTPPTVGLRGANLINIIQNRGFYIIAIQIRGLL
jgi:hypothetical protein